MPGIFVFFMVFGINVFIFGKSVRMVTTVPFGVNNK